MKKTKIAGLILGIGIFVVLLLMLVPEGMKCNSSIAVDVIEGNIIDVHHREIFEGSVKIEDGVIVAIDRHPTASKEYILPGFVNAHVHIESSMLTPENFGRIAIKQGTVAVVSDPHEIANVMGMEGIGFMVKNSKKSPLKTFYTIPSCVPATPFDVAGSVISAADVERLAASGQFVGLSEMMNVPGVLSADSGVMAKLAIAKKYGLPIDGHAPLLRGENLAIYVNNGISTDHECVALEEAEEKLSLGMKVLIREGSAARNYEALKSLIESNPDDVMFCTDDSHPYEIISLGHIKKLVVRSVANGFDLFDVLKIASINPIRHYKLDVGQLRVGDKADFIVVDNIKAFNIQQVYINGKAQIGNKETPSEVVSINNFKHENMDVSALRKGVAGSIKVISIVPGELLTTIGKYKPLHPTGNLESDTSSDIAKIVYINRYNNGVPQIAFCKGFLLKKGAFASSVSHDSHNIIAVGCSDKDLVGAINAIIEHKGGLSACSDGNTEILPLPIGGIMSNCSGEKIAADYDRLEKQVKQMGSELDAPFMTLSFLSLVVIPELKIGEKGLFSYTDFDWIKQ